MIHRAFVWPAPNEPWYEEWKKAADAAKDDALKVYAAAKPNRPEPPFNFEGPKVALDFPNYKVERTTIWGAFKPYLEGLFRNKCAYCESYYRHVGPGPVEHFRPKRRVDEENGLGKVRPLKDHPGYYWLAYEPTNLLPSCNRCNGPRAKMNKFPLADPKSRVSDPGDPLTGEEPLLLNPYDTDPNRDPRRHLSFERDVGKVKQINDSQLGAESIETYRLSMEDLELMRKREQDFYWLRLTHLLGRPDSIPEMWKEFDAIESGEVQYSAAVACQVAPLRELLERYYPRAPGGA